MLGRRFLFLGKITLCVPNCWSTLSNLSLMKSGWTCAGGILVSSLLSGGVIYFSGVRNIFSVAGLIFLLILPVLWITNRVVHRELGHAAPDEKFPKISPSHHGIDPLH